MVFCNGESIVFDVDSYERHNPYFNRWFSAIGEITMNKYLKNMSQSLF